MRTALYVKVYHNAEDHGDTVYFYFTFAGGNTLTKKTESKCAEAELYCYSFSSSYFGTALVSRDLLVNPIIASIYANVLSERTVFLTAQPRRTFLPGKKKIKYYFMVNSFRQMSLFYILTKLKHIIS